MYRIGAIEYGDELYHHGIKGMKWGVRRTPEELGHKVPKRGRDSPKSEPKKRIKIEKASDEKIRTATSRKKLENDYRSEVVRTKELRDRMRKKSGGNGKGSLTQVGTTFISEVLGSAVKGSFGLANVAVKGIADLGKAFIDNVFKTEW